MSNEGGKIEGEGEGRGETTPEENDTSIDGASAEEHRSDESKDVACTINSGKSASYKVQGQIF